MIQWKILVKRIGSLPAAVVSLVALAIYISYGTFLESYYKDSERANYWVYKSPWMWVLLSFLAVVLVAVMVDRWPWRRRHLPFLLAHGGIIVLLVGAFLTYGWGLDGVMVLTPDQPSRSVQVDRWQLSIYSSFDGEKFAKLWEWTGSLFELNVSSKPLRLPLSATDSIEIYDFHPYVVYSKKYRRTTASFGRPAAQVRIFNDRMAESFWLYGATQGALAGSVDLGPLKVIWAEDQGPSYPPRNQIYLWPEGTKLRYVVYQSQAPDQVLKGYLGVNDRVTLPWMGLQLEILQFLPKAEEVYDVEILPYKTNNSVPGFKVRFREHNYWLFGSEVLKLFTDQSVIVVTLGKERVLLDFSLTLKDFRIKRWPQSWQASSYESDVTINQDNQVYTIKMNEPLKYAGFTFYQSSYQQDPSGQVVASILSVNKDPGRFLKYVGSLILVLGVGLLFYDKRKVLYAQIQRQKI